MIFPSPSWGKDAQFHPVMGSQDRVLRSRGDRVPYVGLLVLSDEELVAELQDGNADAFAVVFKRYHRLVHVVALRVLRDAAEAEDLTQAIFLEVYKKVGQFDPARGSLKAWLLQHVHSRAINRRNYFLVRQFHNHVDLDKVEEEVGFWSPRNLPTQETIHLTSEALSVLPEAQKRTIQMVFFEGLSFRDIAERTNETFSNVRHHYYRGLERLRACLERDVKTAQAEPSVMPLGVIRRVET